MPQLILLQNKPINGIMQPQILFKNFRIDSIEKPLELSEYAVIGTLQLSEELIDCEVVPLEEF